MDIKKVLLCIVFLVLLIVGIEKTKTSSSQYTLENYTVQSGDTAWSIMSKRNFANKDIRELIYFIEKDNDIKAGYLTIGQVIKIRIYERGNYE